MHRLLYLRDRHDYGDAQNWTVQIGDLEVRCYATRVEGFNHWCGYVELDGRDISDEDILHVHGGITGGSETSVGFDCAHYGDWCPGPDLPENTPDDFTEAWQKFNSSRTKPTDHYWTFPEVKAETESLAQQIFGTA
jgi:hypothetical protein